MHTMASAPEAVVFDFGGVLFNWQPLDLIRAVLPQHAANATQAAEVAAQVFQSFVPGSDWSEFDRGALAGDAVAARISARTGLPQADVARLMAAIPPHLVPLRASVDWLERLAAQGTRLHFLSNMPQPYAEFLLREHAFLRHFHSGVFSCDVRQVKPNADIFHTTAAQLGLVPQRSVFIDDNAHNIETALGLGWRAVRFVDAAQAETELRQRGWL